MPLDVSGLQAISKIAVVGSIPTGGSSSKFALEFRTKYNQCMKTCGLCKQEKPFEEFHKNKAKGGYQSDCKSCKSIRYKEYYARDKQRYQNNARMNRERCVTFLREYKTGKPCVDCNIVYPHYVMQFDHLDADTKIDAISNMRSTLSKMKKEIEKCELVCANCHAARTYQRRTSA